MDRVIEELQRCNEPVPVPLELPDMDDILDAESQILISLDPQLKRFLLTVSNVVFGTIEPVTVADHNSHTYLPEVAAMAWSIGVPRDLIPICEYGGGYYCSNEIGMIVYWLDGEETDEEPWPDIWQWAEGVWLNTYQ